MMEPIRILAMPTVEGAIGSYRIIEPCKQLGEKGLAITHKLETEKPISTADLAAIAKNTDIMWFQTLLEQRYMWNVLSLRGMSPSMKLVLDIDDNLYNINPWNPSYSAFTCDDKFEGQKFVANMPKERNHARIRMFETMVMEADAIMTTTPLLAARYSHLNKNIYVMPNRLIFRNWDFPHIPKKEDGKVRISWQGGSSHAFDWLIAHVAIKKVLEKHENAIMQFVTSPEVYAEFLRDIGQAKVELWEWIDFSGHSYRLNCIKPDIGVVPLHDDEFSICKSDLKFSEYAVLKVPCVCSNIPPYSKCVVHGETGFLASNEEEFEKYLDLLVNNKEERLRIGENAYQWAKKERCLEASIGETHDMLRHIMSLPSWQIAPKITKEEKEPVLT